MKPFEFHQLAERLLNQEKNAPGFRSAISRAYYGAFLTAVEFLEGMSIYLVSQMPHKEVGDILADAGDPDLDEAGTMLGNLRSERNDADYKLHEKYVERLSHATQCVANAGLVIGRFSTCLAAAARLAAVSARLNARVKALRGLT